MKEKRQPKQADDRSKSMVDSLSTIALTRLVADLQSIQNKNQLKRETNQSENGMGRGGTLMVYRNYVRNNEDK